MRHPPHSVLLVSVALCRTAEVLAIRSETYVMKRSLGSPGHRSSTLAQA